MLWRAILPAYAPIDTTIDFTSLGRRGYIRSAAFLAADQGTAIGAVHLEHAARIEYEGMGKITAPHVSSESWPPRVSSSL